MKVLIEVTETLSGVRATLEKEVHGREALDLLVWQWFEGNRSCDCTRAREWFRQVRYDKDEDVEDLSDEVDCTTERFSCRIVLACGTTIYQDG